LENTLTLSTEVNVNTKQLLRARSKSFQTNADSISTTRLLEIYNEVLNHLIIRCTGKAVKITKLITVRSVDITILSPTKVL